MYLLDTNILLEILLEQSKAAEATKLIQGVESSKLHISEFSLYSIGLKLFRLKRHEVLTKLVADLIVQGGVQVIRLDVIDMANMVNAAQKFSLDFDDAYQYVAAEKHNLSLVSFDSDFDRTEHGRKTPDQVLKDVGVSNT